MIFATISEPQYTSRPIVLECVARCMFVRCMFEDRFTLFEEEDVFSK